MLQEMDTYSHVLSYGGPLENYMKPSDIDLSTMNHLDPLLSANRPPGWEELKLHRGKHFLQSNHIFFSFKT